MVRCGRYLALLGTLWAACRRPLPLTFPEHAALHQRAEYESGSGAALYVGRLHGNEGRAEFLRELDGHLRLLRQLLDALRRLDRMRVPPEHQQALAAERERLEQEARQISRHVREFLDLAVASRLVEAIPELEEALALATGVPAAPGLDVATLRERQRLLGTGPARCGAEQPDPLSGPPPPLFVMARDALEEVGRDVVYDEKQKERLARVVHASLDQRKALGQYGMFDSITPMPGGETWRFRIGSIERSPTGARPADYRVRAVLIDCEFDERGQLRGGRETVLDPSGAVVRLRP
ncbi:MAG: hypothetical protein RMK29_16310 [Myxococcales bacterium]|nr:hypothetical protein [Myxococcota bacterium]MDW8283281.1 hypothetical protein [Myxococcales bacterium]